MNKKVPHPPKEEHNTLDISAQLKKRKENNNQNSCCSVKAEKEPWHKQFSWKQTVIVIIIAALILGMILISVKIAVKKGAPKTLSQMHEENYKIAPTDNNFIYKGMSFVRVKDSAIIREAWYTQYMYNGAIYDIPMRYSPLDVQKIPFESTNTTENKTYSKLYITITPSEENENRQYAALAVSELSQKLSIIKQYPLEAACTHNETYACSRREIVNCTNKEDDVIVFIDDSPNNKNARVIIDGNCFIVQGTDEELIKAIDALIYRFLNIM